VRGPCRLGGVCVNYNFNRRFVFRRRHCIAFLCVVVIIVVIFASSYYYLVFIAFSFLCLCLVLCGVLPEFGADAVSSTGCLFARVQGTEK
jgi:putative flippase GtrA